VSRVTCHRPGRGPRRLAPRKAAVSALQFGKCCLHHDALARECTNSGVRAITRSRLRGKVVAYIVLTCLVSFVCVRSCARMQGSAKIVCAAAHCGVRYCPTRRGCGGRQYVVQSYVEHASALLKPSAALGDWICKRHRDKSRAVAQATPQDIVRSK
jgi:hypothetical protein